MAEPRDRRSLRGDRSLRSREEAALPTRPLHALGAGGDGAPLAGGAAARAGTAVRRDQPADARLDDDGDTRGALAALRRRRLPASCSTGGGRRSGPRSPDDRGTGEGPAARAVDLAARRRRSRPRGAGRACAGVPVPERARSTCCSCAPPTSPSTCRTASSTAASRAPTSFASAARERHRAPAPRLRRLQARGGRAGGIAGRELDELAGTTWRRRIRSSQASCWTSADVGVELVDVTGSVEVAPRLGLADAIVDLVSSGSTLRTNGLRSLGSLFESEAVLIGRRGRDEPAPAGVDPALGRRRAARPVSDAERTGVRTRGDLGARSRLACAERASRSRSRGWWRSTRSFRRRTSGGCCRSLEAAGASSILLVPVERMVS